MTPDQALALLGMLTDTIRGLQQQLTELQKEMQDHSCVAPVETED